MSSTNFSFFAGQYSPAQGSGAIPCPTGTISTLGATACTACPAGKQIVENTRHYDHNDDDDDDDVIVLLVCRHIICALQNTSESFILL